MAVEARHLIGNGETMNPIEGNSNLYNTRMGYGVPLSGTFTMDPLLPGYNSIFNDSALPKTVNKSDSGLTYSIPTLPRKRTRSDNFNPFLTCPTPPTNKNFDSYSFLGEDISLQIRQQQLDIDFLISQHMEKVSLEIEERRKKQARKIIEEIGVGMMKRLRDREVEIENIGKLNWALEERVKSLCVENQIWRDLAQTNEATANALRTKLEQILTQVKDNRNRGPNLEYDAVPITNPLMDDAQSCCGSSGEEEDLGVDWNDVYEGTSRSSYNSRLCRNCGNEESSVLILPCRHLCLCTVCGSSLHTCPICNSTKNASIHVNMS